MVTRVGWGFVLSGTLSLLGGLYAERHRLRDAALVATASGLLQAASGAVILMCERAVDFNRP